MSTTVHDAAEVRINTYTPNSQSAPAVAWLGNGHVVVWQSQQPPADYSGHFDPAHDLYLQRYDAAGARVGGEVHINTVAINDQVQPAVTALPGGGFVVAWASAREHGMTGFDHGIYFQRFDAAGSKVGGETQANSFYHLDQESPSIAAVDGGFVVTWWSDVQSGTPPGILSRKFNADGTPAGQETRVGAATAGPQSDCIVAGLAAGGYVMVWDGSAGLYAQRFDAQGNAMGPQARVDSGNAGGQSQPAATALADGGFLVAWQAQDADGSGIFVQRFAADGAAVGPQVQANETAAGQQSEAAVTALADGGYVVAWTSLGQDGSGGGIYSQRYDAGGNAVGGEVRLNLFTSGDQSDASLAANGNSGFIAAWASQGQDGSASGIYGTQVPAGAGGAVPQATIATSNGIDTAIVGVSLGAVTGYSVEGNDISITTGAGTQAFADVERVRFDDALFALDTGVGGSVWEAQALLWAGLGHAPEVSLVSQWTAAADRAPDMATLAQSMIDHYAPGVSTGVLVAHMYGTITGTAPSADVVQSIASQVGAGLAFETQGELVAAAASLPINTGNFASIVGSVQALDAAWFA